MKNIINKKIDLRRLILGLTIASALIALVNTLFAAYTVQRQQLIDTSKNNNYIYANKLAKSTNDFIKSIQQQLSVSAKIISGKITDNERLTEEVHRLLEQTNSFNSAVIVDKYAKVIATSPNTLPLTGKTLSSPGIIESIETRLPTTSNQYLSTVGNLLIFISHPIVDEKNEYLGLVGGSIYLKQDSILQNLLGEHYYTDGSYLYVVDKNKRIIYHPNNERIGEFINDNSVINKLALGLSGSEIVVNSKGIEMIAGYASVPSTGWGIVSQRPLTAVLQPLDALMQKVFLKALPVALISILIILWCTKKISNPLRQLANGAQSMDDPETAKKIHAIKSWYFEAQELKRAMALGMSLLNLNISKLEQDVQTDPLTKLGNRRCLELSLKRLSASKQKFSVISIDIDHFKKINDTHGHDVGDIVLHELAKHMKAVSRADDILCRVGGEEFFMVLPKSDAESTKNIAERLREKVENSTFKEAVKITISIGVASWPTDASDIKTVFKLADDMLYKAKHNGRNRVEVFSTELATSLA